MSGLVVTVDLFSALLDSRRGGSAAISKLAVDHGLDGVDAQQVFDRWDRENKRLHEEQADRAAWATFRQLAVEAMTSTFQHLRLPVNAELATTALLDSVREWPLWADSLDGLRALSQFAEVGILSNVDGEILSRTAVADHVDPGHLYTSERWRAYKPAGAIYRLTQEAVSSQGADYAHIASSARDVRGAGAAGIRLIHLKRDGIPAPSSACQVDTVTTLTEAASRLLESSDGPDKQSDQREARRREDA